MFELLGVVLMRSYPPARRASSQETIIKAGGSSDSEGRAKDSRERALTGRYRVRLSQRESAPRIRYSVALRKSRALRPGEGALRVAATLKTLSARRSLRWQLDSFAGTLRCIRQHVQLLLHDLLVQARSLVKFTL